MALLARRNGSFSALYWFFETSGSFFVLLNGREKDQAAGKQVESQETEEQMIEEGEEIEEKTKGRGEKREER